MPFWEAFKLDYNLGQQETTYTKLNKFVQTQSISDKISGSYHHCNALTFELPQLSEVTEESINQHNITYIIFSDFYFPKKPTSFY